MEISNICFILAAIMALVGMGMGIYMGSAQDFTLAPAHAHLNLLGWVTMAIYGLYHQRFGGTPGRLRWVQVVLGGLGAPAMAAGLALLLTSPAGSDPYARGETAVIVGSTLALLSMLLFLVVILGDVLRAVRRRTMDPARLGLSEFDPSSG